MLAEKPWPSWKMPTEPIGRRSSIESGLTPDLDAHPEYSPDGRADVGRPSRVRTYLNDLRKPLMRVWNDTS